MASSARRTLRAAYADTSQAMSRLVPTLFITCLSIIVLGGTDDHVMLSGGEVDTPFVGQTRYEIFLVIAPISVFVLRIYIELQTTHLRKLEALVNRFQVRRPITLSANNNKLLLAAGLLAIHIIPPVTIAFLGRHASAVFPSYGVALYAAAVVLAVWSGWSLFDRRKRLRAIAALAFPVIAIAVGATVLHNGVLTATLAMEGTTACTHSDTRPYSGFAEIYFRPVNVSKKSFPGQSVQRRHMVCGFLEETNWEDADMREALLMGADMREAVLREANVSGAIFEFALMRGANLEEVNAFESRFHEADLSRANLSKADLLETRFVNATLRQTLFTGAKISHATFWEAKMDQTNFADAAIAYTKFIDAEIYDAVFDGATIVEVDFFGAVLFGSSFRNAHFDTVTFEAADISCTDFRGASLRDVDFSLVDPEYLRLVRMDPSEASQQITWPDGFVPADVGSDIEQSGLCE